MKLRQVHWVGALQCFNFKIKYHTEKSNTKANALSQRPDYGEAVEEEALVQVHVSFMLEMEMLLQKNSVAWVTKPDKLDDTWTRDHTGLWRNGCTTWVPTDVQESVLNHEHNLPAGHPGVREDEECSPEVLLVAWNGKGCGPICPWM